MRWRRELQRAGKVSGLASLDAWNTAYPDRYLPLSDSALRLGSVLWAQARNAGTPTADPKELDGDVLISAQALDTGLQQSDFIIATVTVGHLALFVPAKEWTSIFLNASWIQQSIRSPVHYLPGVLVGTCEPERRHGDLS